MGNGDHGMHMDGGNGADIHMGNGMHMDGGREGKRSIWATGA